jgi:hypothetical protein
VCQGTFAEWLKTFMEENGIKAADVSTVSFYLYPRRGFHHNVIRNWMRARSLPSGQSLGKLLKVLGHITCQPRKELSEDAFRALEGEG